MTDNVLNNTLKYAVLALLMSVGACSTMDEKAAMEEKAEVMTPMEITPAGAPTLEEMEMKQKGG